MNNIIKDNRHKIDTACKRCFLALDRYNDAVRAFHQERHRINQAPFIQSEKERQVNKAAETLAAKAAAEYDVIHECLEAMRTAAGEMSQLMDIGDDFQHTLSIVTTLKKALPMEQRITLVEPFRGQMQTLSMLRAAYEAADIDPEYYFDGMIFDTAARLDSLDKLAHRIAAQPGKNPVTVIEVGAELEKFAASLGVELTSHFHDSVDTSDALNSAIRSAMGLGTAD